LKEKAKPGEDIRQFFKPGNEATNDFEKFESPGNSAEGHAEQLEIAL
jgi:hypothetical protein